MTKIALDATDIRILRAVQKHGPMSKTKLSETVNLSPTPVWARVTKLKNAGLIRGYHADIAFNLITDVTQVIVTLSLTNHRKEDFQRFESYILAQDDIIDCIATGGGMDYIMKVIVPKLPDFLELMENLLAAELGIERYFTYIVTREIKSSQPNLEKLLGPQS